MARNYYETLGLPMTAAEADIAASLDRELHRMSNLQSIPGRQAEADARRQSLQLIRQTLLNPLTRSKYDAYLSALSNEMRPQIGFAAGGTTSAAPAAAPDNTATVFCCACGRPSRSSAKFCAGCGAGIEVAAVQSTPAASVSPPTFVPPAAARTIACSRCGRELLEHQRFCDTCGASTATANFGTSGAAAPGILTYNSGQLQPYSRAASPSWSGLSTYYQNEFRKIQETGESYKGRWNWAAFFFGFIWALTKGLWLSFLICVVVSLVTGGIGGFVYWFIYGARGNYMYYCAQTKDKQLPL